jgi:DNA-binding response OmpR family regulator
MTGTFNALVIDDNPEVCHTFKKFLARLGCDVSIAESAEEGIDQFSAITYDIVFVALCIREMGARGVARWLRYRFPRTKVMAMTSWKGDLDSSILSIDGIHEVIRKPLNFGELRKTVIRHLG